MKAYLRDDWGLWRSEGDYLGVEGYPTVVFLSRRGTHLYNTFLRRWYRVDLRPRDIQTLAWNGSYRMAPLRWVQYFQHTGYRGVLEIASVCPGLRWLQRIVDWLSPKEAEANWRAPYTTAGDWWDYARETKAVLDRSAERDAPPDQTR